ncbi:MAG: hypothetical protein QXR36_00355 [Desulfurococcaceae archaeon]
MNKTIDSLIVEKVLNALSEVYRKHKSCKYAVLNDVSVVLYGLVKPIEEVRIVSKRDCAEELLYTLLKAFNVEENYAEAVKNLRDHGVVAVSTIFYPLVVVETARSSIDELLVENTIDVELDNYFLRIPKLQHLIAKLIHIGVYPYTEYAYALLVQWLKRIDTDELISLFVKSEIDLEKVVSKLRTILELFAGFPDLTEEFKLGMSLIDKLQRKQTQ